MSAPTGLKIENGKVTWSRVADATGYEVEVNGTVKAVKFTNYDLMTFDALPADGAFTVKARAVADENKGDWSAEATYTHKGGAIVTPTIQGLDGKTLKWTAPTFTAYAGIAEPCPVVVIGETEKELDKAATSFDLSAAASGDVVLYYKADGVYYTDSGKIGLYYDAAGKISFAAPKNVHMEGDMLLFDPVVGANIYYLQDVYGTVTQITGSEVNDHCSDRKGHFLIKEMWAGNTDLKQIGNSAHAPVTYFTEGKGTADEPYLISDASQLRFIEFYEAIGEANYYEITADLAFAAYTPANDEDFSNFYNLGSFSGVLDGKGHTVSNIVVYYKDGYSSIFDNVTENGVIKNLKLASTHWRNWTNRTNDGIMHEKGGECAVLTYTNNGTIENVTLLSGSVTSVKDGAAGLVSLNRKKGVIKGCTVEAGFTVYGSNEAGAFAIYNEGTIEDCMNYGSVGGEYCIGGIVGRNAGTVLRCGNEGSVKGETYAGGITGYNYNIKEGDGMQYNTLIKYCYNGLNARIDCTYYAGGIAGVNGSDGKNETGETLYASAGIRGCYNQGSVKGGISVGGVVGMNFDSSDGTDGFGVVACYSTGDVGYNMTGFVGGRIYLSAEACGWAEDGGALIYVHYWDDGQSSEWPGVQMSKATVNGKEFYYANTPNPLYRPKGIIFSRVNPNYNANDAEDKLVWNQTATLTANSEESFWVYYINSDWASGANSRSAGAIAGFNKKVNDCYYLDGQTVGGTNLKLRAYLSGTGTVNAMQSRAEMRGIYEGLNLKLGENAFVQVEGKYPVLSWQIKEETNE